MKKTICFILLQIAVFFAVAQDVVVINNNKSPFRIGSKFIFLEDTSEKLTFDQVQQRNDFVSKNADIPNFNITSSAIWGKVKFTCKENEDWYLSLDPASFNCVLVYQKTQTGQWKESIIGNEFPIESRLLPVNHFLFKLNVHAGDTTTLFLKVKDYYPLQFDLKVGTLESFVGPTHNIDIYNGICYGIMIMMLIYNFYLYITQKSKVYLYYVLYIFFSLLFSAYLAGYSLHFPKPILLALRFAPIIPPACFGIFGMLFTINFFKEALAPKFVKFIYVFMLMAVLNIILSATKYVHLSENIIQPLGLLLGILSITSAVIALKKKHTSAIYYLIGFGAYMLSLFYLILSAQGVFPVNDFTWHALVIGSAIESILLSFALGDKLKISQHEKEKAQRDSLLQAKENARLIKEQNMLLELKVSERTAELAEKNKDITDSINYARRIQYGILPTDEDLKKGFNNYFVLYEPKDILSGDFYWTISMLSVISGNNLSIIAAADCTGHGVPGAFMSMLGHTLLNQTITLPSIKSPGDVLDFLNLELPKNLKSYEQDVTIRDGMDIALCAFDIKNKKLYFAGANNPCWIVRDNAIIEIKGDKQPISASNDMVKNNFTNHELDLKENDCIYLFTDGYADQFGGPKAKKFKYKQLQEKLIAVNSLPLSEQKQKLLNAFKDWKGNLEQVDDVLIIGIKV
ncbi:MAG: SpoIIE family protein phosphatase [Bacteroidetes bacterium]|nr:SpoIIE family protein phosphatase [Bacteroidota bacterium]